MSDEVWALRLNTSLLKATEGRDLIPITALFKMNVYLLYAFTGSHTCIECVDFRPGTNPWWQGSLQTRSMSPTFLRIQQPKRDATSARFAYKWNRHVCISKFRAHRKYFRNRWFGHSHCDRHSITKIRYQLLRWIRTWGKYILRLHSYRICRLN